MGNNPIMWALCFGLVASVLVVAFTLLMSICVVAASRKYGDKLQKRYEKRLRDLLPGKNCGECGCGSCDAYARGVLYGVEAETACPYVQENVPQEILAVVQEIQLLLEDPKPIKRRKKRNWLFQEKKDDSAPADGNSKT